MKNQHDLTFGERLADRCASFMGSWAFILGQSTLLLCYILWNIFSNHKFDEYPFIFLNLALSFQAAYTAPIIMMAQNRLDKIDRQRSIDMLNLGKGEHDLLYRLEKQLDKHIESLISKIDNIEDMIEEENT